MIFGATMLPFSSSKYFYSWLRLTDLVNLSHLNILVFQTNGKQPYSFPVLSRFCNGSYCYTRLTLRPWQTRTHCCGHIVARDVSWARRRAGNKMNVVFPCCANWETFVADTQNQKHFSCPGHKICVRKFVARAGKRGNICVGNIVSVTMCPRLPGPLKGSLSTRVFETRTATESELFSLFTCPRTTTSTLLIIFPPLEMSSRKIWETIRS